MSFLRNEPAGTLSNLQTRREIPFPPLTLPLAQFLATIATIPVRQQIQVAPPSIKRPPINDHQPMSQRRNRAAAPPRLIDLGRSLAAPFMQLATWVVDHLGEIEAPSAFARRRIKTTARVALQLWS
ncbi:hypothetical protein GGE45_001608 [Rhizobium aethiopicum]|uniref:Uncharacterized protein n=1 Tax=Rhizobium aethiopicum TaxID=1138170 RepID=A0A7W6Q8Z1_9HYPH|nr:hypothetical protein [Rhizobium aethiopicum]MBB4193023.1 hypothetical protein [Rhizobium aethiopicum]MBB4579284.1 hypothetical protein [Rhizobium aethiopicum]